MKKYKVKALVDYIAEAKRVGEVIEVDEDRFNQLNTIKGVVELVEDVPTTNEVEVVTADLEKKPRRKKVVRAKD